MQPQRLRFALEQIRPNQWERFEQFASAFLAAEFPNLRTVAGSGDKARDAELYEPTDDPTLKLQYSVARDWHAKIISTVQDLARNFPSVTELIYATSQKVGPAADGLKTEIRRNHHIFVDIRDREWFVERHTLDAGREAAADALVEDIAEPILADRGLIERKAPALSSGESRAACVHLALQYRDQSRDKGLTKLCFEALTRSTLRDTTPTNRMDEHVVFERVASLVPSTSRQRADVLTAAALARLERRGAVRRWTQERMYCLSHEERQRVRREIGDMELAEAELLEAIDWEVGKTHEAFELKIPANVRELSMCVRVATETVLLQQGELFAAAVATGQPIRARAPDIDLAVDRAMVKCRISAGDQRGVTADILRATTRIVLTEPTESVQAFLRAFADGYTLFAFLRETPDIQSAVVKMFSVGEIWLDTTVVLPLLAETLLEDPRRRRFTNMFRSAVECGLTLRITEGVLEEVETHTWNAIKYSRQPATWDRGRVPFLAASFVMAGNSASGLVSWIEKFRGRQTPEEDLAEYLREEHEIELGSLEQEADSAPAELRAAVQEVWQEAHDRRRLRELDPNTTARLVRHDLENYLGVVQRRRREDRTPFGYRSWWLTLDRTAFDARQALYRQFGRSAPDSPVMSPDFMVSYLTIGPLRAQVQKAGEKALPLSVADLGFAEDVPRELIAEAERLRAELHGKDDRVVRRTLREQCDLQRRRIGATARGGMARVRRELEADLVEAADRP